MISVELLTYVLETTTTAIVAIVARKDRHTCTHTKKKQLKIDQEEV